MRMFNIPHSMRILFAMFMGVAIGAYSGQVYMGVSAIAKAFVTLLNMTALPYISLSLIVGIGSLSSQRALKTFKQSCLILLALLTVMLFFIFMAPLAFPNWENAEFYSASTIKTASELNLVALFFPANPFHAYAHSLIPAVVMFSIFLGVGLIPLKNKKTALTTLRSLVTAIANISSMVMRFAPLGVFCIGLRAAATIDPEQVEGLMVYVITAGVLVALLSFVVLPALVSTITPLAYNDIIKAVREPMVTAFATGSFFSVIPIIVEKTKTLISQKYKDINAEQIPQILIPITFSLPIGGKLLSLLFTLFAAWFSGAYISSVDYINLVVVGLPQLFGTNILAMPNLLDLFNVSNTLFDLFLVSENLIVGRLGAVLSIMVASSFALLMATSMTQRLTFNWRSFFKHLAIIPCLSVVLFMGLGFGFGKISHQYQGYSKFIDRDFLYPQPQSTYLNEPNKEELFSLRTKAYVDALKNIKSRGFIRVGYFRDDLPYAFHNKKGKLVGFDIEIMNQLAEDLGVDIEFVKIFHNEAAPLLNSGYIDITSGIPMIPDNMKHYTLTVPYTKQTLAFLVKDKRRAEFTSWRKIINNKDLSIGIPETFFYKDAVERNFIHGKAWEFSTPRLLFKPEYAHIDGLLFGAPAASGWTLLYPEYTVVVPKPEKAPVSMAFPIHKNDHSFELFMRNWITMKQQNGTLDKLFTYWIEGKQP